MSADPPSSTPAPAATPLGPHTRPVAALRALSVTQIASWGALYYAIAVLLVPIERDTGWSRGAVLGAYSLALGVAALAAPWVGAHIDRHGGRGAMAAGSALAGLLLAVLSQVQGLAAFYAIWLGLGLAMALTLYEPAFAVLTHAYGAGARRAITLLTFAGGFASTVSWPLTEALESVLGWRQTLLAHAAINLGLCLPLHWFCLPAGCGAGAGPPAPAAAAPAPPAAAPEPPALSARAALADRRFWLVAASLTAYGLAFSLMAAHLIPLLGERGMSATAAVAVGSFVGPMQVAGRVVEFTLGRRLSIARVAAANAWLLPGALLALIAAGLPGQGWLLALFVVAYGGGNGIATIVRGALPAELFGRRAYGAIAGLLAAPGNAARAAGAWLGALLWAAGGGYGPVLWALLGVSAAGAAAMTLATRGAGRA